MYRPGPVVRKVRIDNRYEVGDDGNVYADGCVLSAIDGVGVNLHGERKKIAYLVARAFLKNAECRPYVVHKNGDRRDNRAVNLEWSEKEESVHRGRQAATRWCSAYTLEGERVGMWRCPSDAAKEMGLDVRGVRRALSGKQVTCGGLLWRLGV